MFATMIAPILNTVGSIINKAIPDKDLAAKIQQQIVELQYNKDLKEAEQVFNIQLEQIKTNQLDAQSDSKFQSLWRPAVGWICAGGVGYQLLLSPFIELTLRLCGSDIVVPVLDTGSLMFLLSNLLGFGMFRTYEKVKTSSTPQLPVPFK